LNWLEKVS